MAGKETFGARLADCETAVGGLPPPAPRTSVTRSRPAEPPGLQCRRRMPPWCRFLGDVPFPRHYLRADLWEVPGGEPTPQVV
jgi:hypothetical protein